jgi:hypothetical protein
VQRGVRLPTQEVLNQIGLQRYSIQRDQLLN